MKWIHRYDKFPVPGSTVDHIKCKQLYDSQDLSLNSSYHLINIISTDFPSEFVGTVQENLVMYSVSCFTPVLPALTSHLTYVSWSVQFTSTCQMFLSSCYWLGILWGLSDTLMAKHLYLKIQTYFKKDILQAIPVSFNPLSPLFCHKLFFWRYIKQSSPDTFTGSCLHCLHARSTASPLVKLKLLVAQLCSTLCDPMDCSPPGFSVHGIHQARILEWVVISFSKGSPQPSDQTWVSCIAGRFLPSEPPGKLTTPLRWRLLTIPFQRSDNKKCVGLCLFTEERTKGDREIRKDWKIPHWFYWQVKKQPVTCEF